jgi:hypothetical protein
VKKDMTDHKYDILVVYNDNQDIIIENIDHKEIVFFRSTKIQSKNQTLGWVINSMPDALEKRFEVKFFDKYDLLNEGNTDKTYFKNHLPELQIGMIIRVKLGDFTNKEQEISKISNSQSTEKTSSGSSFFDTSSNIYPFEVQNSTITAATYNESYYNQYFDDRKRKFWAPSPRKDDDITISLKSRAKSLPKDLSIRQNSARLHVGGKDVDDKLLVKGGPRSNSLTRIRSDCQQRLAIQCLMDSADDHEDEDGLNGTVVLGSHKKLSFNCQTVSGQSEEFNDDSHFNASTIEELTADQISRMGFLSDETHDELEEESSDEQWISYHDSLNIQHEVSIGLHETINDLDNELSVSNRPQASTLAHENIGTMKSLVQFSGSSGEDDDEQGDILMLGRPVMRQTSWNFHRSETQTYDELEEKDNDEFWMAVESKDERNEEDVFENLFDKIVKGSVLGQSGEDEEKNDEISGQYDGRDEGTPRNNACWMNTESKDDRAPHGVDENDSPWNQHTEVKSDIRNPLTLQTPMQSPIQSQRKISRNYSINVESYDEVDNEVDDEPWLEAEEKDDGPLHGNTLWMAAESKDDQDVYGDSSWVNPESKDDRDEQTPHTGNGLWVIYESEDDRDDRPPQFSKEWMSTESKDDRDEQTHHTSRQWSFNESKDEGIPYGNELWVISESEDDRDFGTPCIESQDEHSPHNDRLIYIYIYIYMYIYIYIYIYI